VNLDEFMKQTIAWNLDAFRAIYTIGARVGSSDLKALGSMGYSKNYQLLKQIANLQFVAGDEEAATLEAQSFGMTDGPMSPIGLQHNGPAQLKAPPTSEDDKRKRDMEELEKIFALEYDEKERTLVTTNDTSSQSASSEPVSGKPRGDGDGGTGIPYGPIPPPSGPVFPKSWFTDIFKRGESGPQS
jgi:hypothetical protein